MSQIAGTNPSTVDVQTGSNGLVTLVAAKDGENNITGTANTVLIKGNEQGGPLWAGAAGAGNNLIIQGLGGADDIVGSSGNDQLYGNQGIDIINGLGGNDVIAGGADNDLLYGNQGNDSTRCAHFSGFDQMTFAVPQSLYKASTFFISSSRTSIMIGLETYGTGYGSDFHFQPVQSFFPIALFLPFCAR